MHLELASRAVSSWLPRGLCIPNSGRDVEYKLDEKSIEFVLDKHGVTKLPSVQSLAKSIKQMKSADEHFLRTFMMLVLSSFLCPTTSLNVSPRCFPSLVDMGSIRELNWCKFVVEQLENCISSNGKKNWPCQVLEYRTAIQPASLKLDGEPSTVTLFYNGNPSKEGKNLKSPVVDLSTPTSSDSECTVKRTIGNPPSVNSPKRSS